MDHHDRLDVRMERTPPRHAQAVVVPHRHEGVGLALRRAYLPRASDLPADLVELLDRLR